MVSIDTLVPGFLVASPALQDPNFNRTVLLMCVHNEEGAMGLVINRPAPMTLKDIMNQLGVNCTVDVDQPAMVGGPVALENGLLLYETAADLPERDGELQITDTLRLCPNRELLHEIAHGEGPGRYMMFLGHSGWGPGQLETECSQGAWIPTAMKHELIFGTPNESRWEEALRQEGLNPAQIGTARPKA